jgi:hypothetical protein
LFTSFAVYPSNNAFKSCPPVLGKIIRTGHEFLFRLPLVVAINPLIQAGGTTCSIGDAHSIMHRNAMFCHLRTAQWHEIEHKYGGERAKRGQKEGKKRSFFSIIS